MSASTALAPALAAAAPVIARVAQGRSLAGELDGAGGALGVPVALRAAVLDLTHGTLRRYGRVQAIVGALAQRGVAQPLEALLWAALYALESGRYADYTVVDQAVRACALLEKWPAKGFVNALLRRYLRERHSIEATLAKDPQAHYQHPLWWIRSLEASYGAELAHAILAAGNTHPPMALRVNRRRTDAKAYVARLAEQGIAARCLTEVGLLLEQPVPTDRLPGFAAGEVSVQDLGAQRAARCLELRDGQRVLDACAAPGGKSAHILESAEVALTALDADPARCARLAANLERVGVRARVKTVDCMRLDEWWDGVPFDRILADVPCSASGVARRHPDLKWLRREADVEAFASRQDAILGALWQVLAPDGKLLYVTCSVFTQENDAVLERFVGRTPAARRVPLPDGEAERWLPCAEHDGFYLALIRKQP